MTFTPIKPRSRPGNPGGHNITYRNGSFRLDKFTVERAGAPSHVEVLLDSENKEVLLKPTKKSSPYAHKLAAGGRTPWGNSFSSHDLARRLGLPLEGKTVRFFTEWDEQEQALRFSAEKVDKAS